ncbi:hypothetical protein [Kitasatospora sp. MBT63]|uniref:hypothetical protein n=1 Tax=Kitasatospora sp. MBT63 TaxID=1444768 RepID=UPI00053A2687|nr:hypothetical protein [Kitasatospora sp. MBT63]
MDLGERLDRQERGLDALLDALALSWQDEADERVARLAERQPHYPQYHRIGHKRQTVRRALEGDRAAAVRHYDQVLAVLLLDDDHSSPRWLAAALVAAAGRRRVLESLLHAAEAGTPDQRRCAAHAWRWAEPPLRYPNERARLEGRPTATSRAERDAVADLEQRFRAATG